MRLQPAILAAFAVLSAAGTAFAQLNGTCNVILERKTGASSHRIVMNGPVADLMVDLPRRKLLPGQDTKILSARMYNCPEDYVCYLGHEDGFTVTMPFDMEKSLDGTYDRINRIHCESCNANRNSDEDITVTLQIYPAVREYFGTIFVPLTENRGGIDFGAEVPIEQAQVIRGPDGISCTVVYSRPKEWDYKGQPSRFGKGDHLVTNIKKATGITCRVQSG